MTKEFDIRQVFELKYTSKDGKVTEYFDAIDNTKTGQEILVARKGKWGCIIPGIGIVIPLKYEWLKPDLNCEKRYTENIVVGKKNMGVGVITTSEVKLCNFKYLSVETCYYYKTESFVVEDKSNMKGVVKNCKEIISLCYHKIEYNHRTKIWKCTFNGLAPVYYTVDGEVTRNSKI